MHCFSGLQSCPNGVGCGAWSRFPSRPAGPAPALRSSRAERPRAKSAADWAFPADRATQEEGFSLELRTRDRERKLLKKINETIEKIDEDDYGFCEACGVEIGIRRLEARPTATLCVDCKTLAELKEKQLGG